jgi:two-component system LytT family response regulator
VNDDRLSCIVVDDEPLARELLLSMLEGIGGVDVLGEYGDGAAALRGIRERDPDLVFLDIQMPARTGIEVLRELGAAAPDVIFVTAYDRYALDAFQVDAVDYLLKPFDEERLEEAVERARRRRRAERSAGDTADAAGPAAADREATAERLARVLERLDRKGRYLERIAVREKERTLLQPIAGIEWFEAEGKYIRLHLDGGGTRMIRQTMISLEEALDPARFVRVSRSAILNIDRIAEIHPWFNGELSVRMQSGAEIRTTRSYRDALKRVMENG